MRPTPSYGSNNLSSRLITGFALETSPVATSPDKCIVRLLTENYGKISCIYSQDQSPPIFPLDELEVVLGKNIQALFSTPSKSDERLHRPGLLAITECTKLYSCLETIQMSQAESDREKKSEILNPFVHFKRKNLSLAGSILNTFLIEKEPHKPSWNLLLTLVPLAHELNDIKAVPLLISLLFFEQEGIDFEEIQRAIKTSFPYELQEKILKDISILFFEKTSLLFSHDFSNETLDLVTGILGLTGKKSSTKR